MWKGTNYMQYEPEAVSIIKYIETSLDIKYRPIKVNVIEPLQELVDGIGKLAPPIDNVLNTIKPP